MEDKRKYHIIIGSKGYFDMNLPEFTEDDVVDDFLELVKISDTAKQNRLMLDQHADILTIKNNSYHGIVEAAHDRLGPLIEELPWPCHRTRRQASWASGRRDRSRPPAPA